MTIWAIFGNIGSGKTCELARQGLIVANSKKHAKQVYSNFKINDEKIKLINADLFSDMKEPMPSLTLLDEIYIYLDSRCSMSMQNRVLGYVCLQSRKRGIDIIYSAQLGSSVDKRLKNLTSMIIYAKGEKNGYFHYSWILNSGKTFNYKISIKKLLPIFEKYDTNEIVELNGN